MMNLTFGSTRTLLALATIVAATILGCASTMNTDESGAQMSAGLTDARNGLAKAQTGVDEFTAGSRQPGITDLSDGMDMMDQGTTRMRKGMGMMSGGMMMNCVDAGSDTILGPIQKAWDELQQGWSMICADASINDEEVLTHIKNGTTMMKAALDDAEASMRCMGHQGMMSGSMMR